MRDPLAGVLLALDRVHRRPSIQSLMMKTRRKNAVSQFTRRLEFSSTSRSTSNLFRNRLQLAFPKFPAAALPGRPTGLLLLLQKSRTQVNARAPN
jgi:hypothetical protein